MYQNPMENDLPKYGEFSHKHTTLLVTLINLINLFDLPPVMFSLYFYQQAPMHQGEATW